MFAGVIVGVCAAASTLLAQSGWAPQEGIETLPRGAGINQQADALGWTFHPLANGVEVTGFFATLQGQDAIGANVKLMYFSVDAQGEWRSFGWAEDGTDGAVAWIRAQHGADALGRSRAFSTFATSATPVAPEEMKKGIFLSDPNADLFETMDPQAAEVAIAWLVESGYAAPPKLGGKLITEFEGGPKVLNNLMGFLANQAEYTLYPLKTTFAKVEVMEFCSCSSTTGAPTVLQPPGAAVLVGNPRRTVDGQCIYRFERPIKTRIVTSTGREWYCPSCAGTATETLHEYTEVIAPCPPRGGAGGSSGRLALAGDGVAVSVPKSQRLITAAIVTAAAAACVQAALTAPYLGWGLALARLGEVWGQRLLPGQLMIRQVYPGWRDELMLVRAGRIALTNGRPEQGWGSYWLCLPNLALTLVLAAAAAGLHLAACRALTQNGPGAAAVDRTALIRRSALGAAAVFLLYETLRWFWAGAQRGALTQAVVGRRVADIAFGPWGRASLLLGAVAAYAAVLLWTARACRAKGAAGLTLEGRPRRRAPVALTLAALLLLLTFPYWQGIGFVLLGEMPVYDVRNSVESRPLAKVINTVAPMP